MSYNSPAQKKLKKTLDKKVFFVTINTPFLNSITA